MFSEKANTRKPYTEVEKGLICLVAIICKYVHF